MLVLQSGLLLKGVGGLLLRGVGSWYEEIGVDIESLGVIIVYCHFQ
jgi:hypothetical protein